MKKLPIVTSSKLIHEGFFSLREDLLQREGGEILSYTTLVCTDAVAVLAQDNQGRWIINREYRHATGETLIGLPGGRLEKDEDPIEGGKREFREETGYDCMDATLIGCCHPFPGLCNQKIYYILVKNCVKVGEQKLDPLEFIDTCVLSDQELRLLIKSGAKTDGILITGLWYKDHF